MHLRPVLALAVAFALVACGHEEPKSTLPSLPALATHTVAAGGAAPGRAWDGVVEAVRQGELTAQTSGRVTSVEVDVDDRVEAGAVLLRLAGVEQRAGVESARAALQAAEANARQAQADYERHAALASRQFVSRLQLDQARAARDAAAAVRDGARAQLAQAGQQADYTVVRAPFAGIVSARHVEPGESVAPGQALLSLYAPGALRIEVQVPQSDAQAIRAADKAQVVLADGRAVAAPAVTVFPAADARTHSVGVRVDLPEMADAPQPGVTAKVVFPIAGGEALLLVPSGALVRRGEVSGVYVLAGDRLSLRQVRLGRQLGGQVEVLAGLYAGETIAADAVAALQALSAPRLAARGDD